MSSKKRKPKGRTEEAAPGGASPSPSSSKEDEIIPEMDLISLDETEPVQLGDFTAVWQHLSSTTASQNPAPNSSADPPDAEPAAPVTRKQFLQKSTVVKQSVIVPTHTKQMALATQDPEQSIMSAVNVKDKRSKNTIKTKNKRKSINTYSSPEDDIDAENPSSYEDNNLYSPRRKSFLYIPPTFTTPVPSPKTKAVSPATPSAADRRPTLVQKLVKKYPSEAVKILLSQSIPANSSAYLSALTAPQSSNLHIFIDNSNILIGFYQIYKEKRNISDPFFRSPKFDFRAFTTIIERGRPVSRKILVGSNPLTQPVAVAQDLGYEVSILERVVDTSKRTLPGSPYASDSATRTPQREKKKEQAVDEILHLKILECLLDVAKPATIVLATGDAAPAEFSREGGFLKCIQRALTRGWHVELVCWRKSMSKLWREKVFRVEWSDTFTVVELDDYVDELVLE
jgi:hypothetical protein